MPGNAGFGALEVFPQRACAGWNCSYRIVGFADDKSAFEHDATSEPKGDFRGVDFRSWHRVGETK
jgi:hypothetical protein